MEIYPVAGADPVDSLSLRGFTPLVSLFGLLQRLLRTPSRHTLRRWRTICLPALLLAYASQQESPRSRVISRSRKIRMRLGGSPDVLQPFPKRPRGMHQRTYMRLRARDPFDTGGVTVPNEIDARNAGGRSGTGTIDTESYFSISLWHRLAPDTWPLSVAGR